MRAAQVHEVGGLPAVGDTEAPAGDDVVEVLAAPVNPIDLAVSRGILATGHPPLPYVPGCEGVGRTSDGRVVWVFGGGHRRAPDRIEHVARPLAPERVLECRNEIVGVE